VSPTIFEWIVNIIAVLLCAFAVKLMDDYLDVDLDARGEHPNFTHRFGKGTPIYAMLSLALAASSNAPLSLPLFFASYSIGMFHDVKEFFPSGLSGLQESMLIFLIGLLLWGWQSMFFSLFFILSIQLFDDYLDIHTDQLTGYRNFAHRFGKTECLLLSLLSLLISWWLDVLFFFPALIGAIIFYCLIFFYQGGKSSCY